MHIFAVDYLFFIVLEFKSLQERCMSVIVSALLEQRASDPDVLCSKLPDYVPTITRSGITDAVWDKWVPASPDSSSNGGSPALPTERSTSPHEVDGHREVSPRPSEPSLAAIVEEIPGWSSKPLPEKPSSLPNIDTSFDTRPSLSPSEQLPLSKKAKCDI